MTVLYCPARVGPERATLEGKPEYRNPERCPLKIRIPFVLLLFFTAVGAQAVETKPSRFVCAARIDCGSPGFPSTQDLPVERTPTVLSPTVEAARSKCLSVHTTAYLRLARSIDELTPTNAFSASRGCKIVSEAFPAH